MPYTGAKKSLALIISQLEAASSLIKFAADDLHELSDRASAPLPSEMRIIAENLQAQAGTLEGNVAFFRRVEDEVQTGGLVVPPAVRKVSSRTKTLKRN